MTFLRLSLISLFITSLAACTTSEPAKNDPCGGNPEGTVCGTYCAGPLEVEYGCGSCEPCPGDGLGHAPICETFFTCGVDPMTCAVGRADCVADDQPGGAGCETLTDTDPQHCGGCGQACDPGQACLAGHCS